MNKKLFLAALLCFDIALMITFANATMTDGNYVMIAYDTTGSGEATLTDTNYVTFLAAGETTASNIANDNNYSTGTGFYGNPLIEFIVTIIPPPIVSAITTVFMILPEQVGSNIPQTILIIAVCLMLFYFFIKKRLKHSANEEGIENG